MFRGLKTPALVAIVAAVAWLLPACGHEHSGDYVARLGEQVLTEEELDAALQSLPAEQDSADARQQIVEQWITNELLFQEAQRRGLRETPEVQRLLSENERSVLVSALVAELYEETPPTFSPTDIRAYYEQHKDQLRLREPFVRVAYLVSASRDSAEQARALLQKATSSARYDSLVPGILTRFAQDPQGSINLLRNYYPQSQLLALAPSVHETLAQLGPRQIAPVLEAGDRFHLLQLIDRVPAGTIPQLNWIEAELTQRLTIQARKQLYARQVQRLRNEALAREALDIR